MSTTATNNDNNNATNNSNTGNSNSTSLDNATNNSNNKPKTITGGVEGMVNISTTISDEMSKRICTHMNEDHKISIYCMAVHAAVTTINTCTGTASESLKMKQIKHKLLSYRYKISSIDVILKNVTMDNCTIQIISCDASNCTMDTILYPFIPPLQYSNEIRKRMVQIHHTVLRPLNFINLLSIPVLALTIIQLLLFFLTYVLTYKQRYDILHKVIQYLTSTSTTGSTLFNIDTITYIIPKITKLLIILHFIEADIVVLYAKLKLKLKYDSLLQWFLFTLFYGIFISIPFFYHIIYRYNYYTNTTGSNQKNKNKNH